MPRSGITYDEVAQAADKIKGEGVEPSINRVRELLGTGSPNTIHRHLTSWKAIQPQAKRDAPELPADLQAALVKEIERQVSAARAEAENDALEAQRTADQLADEGEALEEDNERLRAEGETATREKEQAQALAEDRAKEIERLKEELDREQRGAESARMDLATEKHRKEALADQVDELKQALSEARANYEAEVKARQDADQRAAVATAKQEAAIEKAADLKARVDELKDQVKAATETAETRAQALQKSQQDAYERSREAADWKDKYTEQTDLVDELESKVKALADELDASKKPTTGKKPAQTSKPGGKA